MSFVLSVNSTHFSSALVTPRPRSDVTVTPPPSPTPFRPVPVSALPCLTLSESLAEALATPPSTPPLAAPPAGTPPRKRARSPSPIPIMRLNRNKQIDEWMKLAAAKRIIFFCYLTTDGSFTQDFILKNRLNYFTVDAKPFDVYKHPLQACRLGAPVCWVLDKWSAGLNLI